MHVPTRLLLGGSALLLAGWILWLRWPTFGYPVWNLDEGIYATTARVILDGGVMYRDAIDHRTPLAHYLTALVFAVGGVNNMWALHAALAVMIAATAYGVFLLGRHWYGAAGGGWAAFAFAGYSTSLLYVGDAYSLSTEWCLAACATWAAWWIARALPRPGFWPPFVAGLGYAGAFLSKQPGLLEVGAPLAVLAALAALGRIRWLEAARAAAGLVSGFTALTALVFAYFAARGALDDFYFYGWTFNLVYYGSGPTWDDRWRAAAELVRLAWAGYPALLLVAGTAVIGCLRAIGRQADAPPDAGRETAALFLLAWLALSTAGAASAGRIFAHYYIQAMPALALVTGWGLASLTRLVRAPGHRLRRTLAALVVFATGWSLVAQPLRSRARPSGGSDPAQRAADFVNQHAQPGDRIFVWGLYPDFYVYANRAPASRFLYCSFQTGVSPGAEAIAGYDADARVVPGTMDVLLHELEASRPVFFVDTSAGSHRFFRQHPVTRFPGLARFLSEHYVEIHSPDFGPHGFRVHVLKDSSRRQPERLVGHGTSGELGELMVAGLPATVPAPAEYTVHATHSGGGLQRVEILVNDQPVESVTLPPGGALIATFLVPFDAIGPGTHRVTARATSATGETRDSPALEVICAAEPLTPAQLEVFALPTTGRGPRPLRVTGPYGAAAGVEGGSLVFYVHAPSSLLYPLAAGANLVAGRYGFRPGAYAASNPGRTDGAEFVVTWIDPAGIRRELHRRWLRPSSEPSDRGEHAFECRLPEGHPGGQLEFAITAGPAGNVASDWTYWSDIRLSLAR